MADPDYFTLAEFQLLPDLPSATEAEVLAAAAYFTEIVEREVGRPLVPRTFTETFSGCGSRQLVLGQPDIRSLTTVTVDGASVNVALLTAVSGVLQYLGGGLWSGATPSNVVVVYSAGKFATCPADIKNAVMWATRDRLLEQSNQAGIDVRKTSVSTEFGVTSYVLPGEKRPTGYPELDALIASYSRKVPSLGFA